MNAVAKRRLIWLILLILVLTALAAAFWPRALAVDMVIVSRGPMQVTVSDEGYTRIHDVYELSAPVAGRLQRMDARAGDVVIAGQTVLARVEPGDPTLLDPRTEAQTKAAILAAESARDFAMAEVDQASADLDFATTEWKRANQLAADGTISQRALDEAERELKRTRAQLATARASLQMRLFEVDQAKASLMSPLETMEPALECECVPLTAPVDGRVLRVFSASERVVAPGEPLVEIGDPRDLEIVVDYLSTDAVQIQPGQPAMVEEWGGANPLAARVRRVEPFAFMKVSALGIEERRVNVVIDLEDEIDRWSKLGHGYQILGRVVIWSSDDALTVPSTALFRDGDRWAVFVEDGSRANVRHVQIGRQNAGVVQVLGGLDEGELIIDHPSNRIASGVRVRPRPGVAPKDNESV